MRASLTLALALVAAPLAGCHESCVVYAVVITAEDQATGKLVCEGRVTLGGGEDALDGAVLDGSSAPSDAEVPSTSPVCQWDTLVSGGTFTIAVRSPGFSTASVTLTLPGDTCGSATIPVEVLLTRET